MFLLPNKWRINRLRNCFIQGLKLVHQSCAEFVNYFSPSRLLPLLPHPRGSDNMESERRERREGEKEEIAYDNPLKYNEAGKSLGKDTYMQGMISLNDRTMIMKCIYNSYRL